MGDYIDFISFHEYTNDETKVFETVEAYTELAHYYNPKIRLIQGESGSQSKMGGHGALCDAGWTEEIQAKQLARHTIADLMTDVYFTSYFSCVDMIEALNGTPGDVASYLDYTDTSAFSVRNLTRTEDLSAHTAKNRLTIRFKISARYLPRILKPAKCLSFLKPLTLK